MEPAIQPVHKGFIFLHYFISLTEHEDSTEAKKNNCRYLVVMKRIYFLWLTPVMVNTALGRDRKPGPKQEHPSQ